jgi:hypothetical protein
MLYDHFIKIYLDYTNDYLTVAKFAEHNCISEQHAREVLILATYYYENGPEL